MTHTTGFDTYSLAHKLPHENDHLFALQRMRTLETYYNWSYDLFKSHMGKRILDAGSGVGNFTAIAEKKAEYVLAVDLSSANIQVLRNRFKDSAVVEIAQVDLETQSEFFRDKRLDTVVCLDVLEHVEDDVSLLKSFFEIVQPGGHLLVKVPACPWLFGSIDLASGHYQRYTLRELRLKAAHSGWETITVAYMNISGVIPYWLKSCVFRKRTTFSQTFKPWQLRLVRVIVPILKLFDKIVGPPIGQSAILIARKPTTI